MQKDGKYIYCIITSNYDSNFGPIGLGGRCDLVTTIGIGGLCMVVSDHPLTKFVVNPENILTHQKVIEEVMKEHTSVLPVKFGTIAATPDEIRNLLDKRSSEFSELLEQFENKVEINLKATWKDMNMIFKEINEENSKFREIRKDIENMQDWHVKKSKLAEAGKIVEEALAEKKETEKENILRVFNRIVFDYKHNKTNGDETFINTALLLNSGREKEIDYLMEDLGYQYKDRIDFIYTSPLPAFNFIDIKIFQEEWEV